MKVRDFAYFVVSAAHGACLGDGAVIPCFHSIFFYLFQDFSTFFNALLTIQTRATACTQVGALVCLAHKDSGSTIDLCNPSDDWQNRSIAYET